MGSGLSPRWIFRWVATAVDRGRSERGDRPKEALDLRARPALIVIDMQNGACREAGSMRRIGLDYQAIARAIDPIASLLRAARATAIPIFHASYCFNDSYSDAGLMVEMFPGTKEVNAFVRGTWDASIVDELEPLPGEIVIEKTRYSAFFGTDLEARLKELEVDTLIVCGQSTNICVDSTVRDAFFRDIRVVVPSDGTTAFRPEFHKAALQTFENGFGRVATVEAVIEALSRLQ